MERIGNFKILRVEGRGGMGRVYKARSVIGEIVALKVFEPIAGEYTAKEMQLLRNRFLREAKILWKTTHPNIVSVLHVGYHCGGTPYFVMEYLPHDLAKKLRLGEDNGNQTRLVSENNTIKIAKSLLSALRCLHDKGIIHRDIKPENILFASNGVMKLADFGIAKWERATRYTGVKSILGTDSYMAPEQKIDSADVTNAADLYSVGIVLYRMLTGFHPNDTKFEKPSRYRIGISHRWEKIIGKATEREPANRFRNAREMSDAIEAIKKAYDDGTSDRDKGKAAVSLSKREKGEPSDGRGPTTRKAPRTESVTVLERDKEKIFKVCSDGHFEQSSVFDPQRRFEETNKMVVLDSDTWLMWLKEEWKSNRGEFSFTHKEAFVQKDALNSLDGGRGVRSYSDWRIPTIDELTSLLGPEKYPNGFRIAPVFLCMGNYDKKDWCWSSDVEGPSSAWGLDVRNGIIAKLPKNFKAHVRFVRTSI